MATTSQTRESLVARLESILDPRMYVGGSVVGVLLADVLEYLTEAEA